MLSVALIEAAVIVALLINGNTIEGFGGGLLLGLVLGAPVGAAWMVDRQRKEPMA